jgi:hypothetical protein
MAMQRICGIRNCGEYLGRGEVCRGVRLCTPCRNLLASRLCSLPGLYVASEQVLEVRRYHSIRIARGCRPSGICLDERTLAMRGDTIRVLCSWCEMIVDERGVSGPCDLEITLLTAFLRAHLDWLTVHPAAADFAQEIAGLADGAGEALAPANVSTIDLGPCIKDGCGRMVRATLRLGSPGSAPHVRCDGGHTWPPHQWLSLRHQLEPRRMAGHGIPA